jgi:hypothetical protein
MLQAILGKPEEAQRSLTRALEGSLFSSLDATPWALLGKICEAYGITDCSEAAYGKAVSSAQPDMIAQSAVSLVSVHR